MIDPLAMGVLALALVLAVVGGVLGALDRQPGKPLLQGILVLQLLLVVQAVLAGVRLSQGVELDERVSFVGYLAVSALLVPGGLVLAVEERSRYGTLVLAVACLVVAVVEVRLLTVWSSA